MKYRSRPVEVEAVQWWADGAPGELASYANEVIEWVNANGGEARYEDHYEGDFAKPQWRIAVHTINGWAFAAPGHYVVMGTATFEVDDSRASDREVYECRDFYPVDPETFDRRWEPIKVVDGGSGPE